MIAAGVLAAPLALAVDTAVGEPPAAWHPVAWFGVAMTWVERRLWADDRLAGAAHLAAGVGVSLGSALALERLLGRWQAAVVAGSIALGGRMLGAVALGVADELGRGDVDAGRRALGSLVGRDASALDEPEIVRAVVESVAENSVDAVTATLWWTAIGGAPGALVHRAVNTLDAMVGYRDDRYRRYGWASARADDAVNWIPARLTAVAVGAVRPSRAATVWRIVRRDGHRHPSPNGGVVESAFAAALGVRLGGANDYGGTVEMRGPLGDGPPPVPADIARAVRLSRDVSWFTAALPVLVVALARLVRTAPRTTTRAGRITGRSTCVR